MPWKTMGSPVVVDANVLLCAVDEASSHHLAAAEWLTLALNGNTRVGLPWQTLGAFVRISTHPRVAASPLSAAEAQSWVDDWLKAPAAWVPSATKRTVQVFGDLIRNHQVTGNLVTDAQLAALAIEHGVPMVSVDSDFARFPEVTWLNPLA